VEILEGLLPERVFYHFEQISKIPRGSKNEKEISDYLLSFASTLGLEATQDYALNIMIKKRATSGYENAPTVLIQGHMDMVCEKNEGTVHDFEKDPIKLVVDGDYISAQGTTLGADNGIAVAMAMALLESSDIAHPALEVLITSDEEMGMTGASKVDGALFDSSILINLDSEGEGVLTAGCAGGARVKCDIPIKRVDSNYKRSYALVVKGLKGGHSGVDIHLERANANIILARVLNKIMDYADLCSISGGSKDNAIPREACAIILIEDVDGVNEIVKQQEALIQNEFAITDENIVIDLQVLEEHNGKAFSKETYRKIVSSIMLIPNGPMVKSTKIDLVVSSNSIGVVNTLADSVSIICAPRSSIKSLMDNIIDSIELLAHAIGAKMTINARYPGWEYKKDSYIRDLATDVYKKLTGKDIIVEAIHAGLECGLLMDKIDGLDAVSLGPQMYDIHTPDERLSICSVGRCYYLLCEILKEIV